MTHHHEPADDVDAQMRAHLGAKPITGTMLVGSGVVYAYITAAGYLLQMAVDLVEQSDGDQHVTDELRDLLAGIHEWSHTFEATGRWLSKMHDEREAGKTDR